MSDRFTEISPRTDDKLTASANSLVTKHLLNPGEPVELLLVFLVLLVVVLADPDRVLSVTCAVVVTCLLQTRLGEDGIDLPTRLRSDTLWLLPLPLPLFHLWSWPEVTESLKFQSCL